MVKCISGWMRKGRFILPAFAECHIRKDGDECEKGIRRSCEDAPCGSTGSFTDDVSNIPEKYRQDSETREPPKETSAPQPQEISKPSSPPIVKPTGPDGFEVKLKRKHETWETEVLLNGRVKRQFMVDTGASSCLIDWETAKDLEITIDESTPFMPVS